MYLKSLQINGFKSFAKNTSLDFKSNISAIVGPNGSGKSNVAESFRFALGEQSLKNMRGKKGEDLIFSGRNSRLNRASVKVIFDNNDKQLDIDYDQVEIERTVFRDGINEYILNKSKVRAKDITELLSSANIGSTGHHIISQGEADKILTVNPKERKTIVEDALGLKLFIIRKTETERKLEKTEENLKEVRTKQKINTPRIKFLAREVEKAEKIKSQKEELEKLYMVFFPRQKKIKNSLEKLNLEIEEITKDKIDLEQKINFKKDDLKTIKSEGSQVTRKDERIDSLERELQDLSLKKSDIQKELAKVEYGYSQIKLKKEEWEKNYLSQQKKEEIYNLKLNDILDIIQEFFQKKDIGLATKILDYFGVTKDGESVKDFSGDDLSSLEENIDRYNKELEIISEKENNLLKKIRILSLDGENSSEVFGQELQIEILQLEKKLGFLVANFNSLQNKKNQILKELENYRREEIFAISIFGANKLHDFNNIELFNKPELLSSEGDKEEKNIFEKIQRVRILLENSGSSVSEELIEEYKFLVKNQEFIKGEVEDLEKTKKDLEKIIFEVKEEIEKRFRIGVEKINKEFSRFFETLFSGGKAEIFLIKIPLKNQDEIGEKMLEFEIGLDIKVSLPNKKITGLAMLSGGERSLVSIALLFAMSAINPPPFIILDETDAALDEANSKRYGDMIEKLAEHSQLILITHNRETMSRAGILYGITMDAEGVSRLLSVSFEEAEKVAK